MVGMNMRQLGTFLAFDPEDLKNSRSATNADWRQYNSGDRSVKIGMGGDGNYYVLTKPPVADPAKPAIVESKPQSNENSAPAIVAEVKKEIKTFPAVKAIKPEDVVIRDDLLRREMMQDLIFENIGGMELIDMSRTDMVNGQDVAYQPIKNISNINSQYNPQNLISIAKTSAGYFKNFPISLDGYTETSFTTPFEFDESGNLVIYLINVPKNEQVQVQIFTSAEVLNGTIY
jgi:hypothetical protein